jgi:thiol-disulfide isomerase/thioredoxin
VALALLVPLGARYEHHAHYHLLHPGDSLIPLAVANLNGTPATIANGGRPQIINVFATWCTPCRNEMPAFAAMAKTLARRGVEVVGIDQQEDASQVERFAREFSLTYPIYIDRGTVTHDVLGARMIPATIYVDGRGIIRWQHAGPLNARDIIALERSAG